MDSGLLSCKGGAGEGEGEDGGGGTTFSTFAIKITGDFGENYTLEAASEFDGFVCEEEESWECPEGYHLFMDGCYKILPELWESQEKLFQTNVSNFFSIKETLTITWRRNWPAWKTERGDSPEPRGNHT